MILTKKLFFLMMLMILTLSMVNGQIIENYSERLAKVDKSSWLKSSESIRVTLDVQQFPLSGFRFKIPSSATVFMNERLWFYAKGDSSFYLSTAQLKENFNVPGDGKIELTVLKKGIKKEEVSIHKGFFEDGVKPEIATEITNLPLKKRVVSEFYDFFFLAFIFILFLIAIFKVIYPLVLTSILSPISVFSAEDFSESNSVQRFFAIDVIFYVMIVSMLITLTGMVVLKESDFAQWQFLVDGDLNQLFLYWLIGTLGLFILTVLKFILLKFMAYIFELGKYEFSHFFYLLRIISILVLGIVLIIILIVLNNPEKLTTVINYGLICFFWIYILGIFMLMLIMMNRVAFKKYHLFAYICTAELVPFLIISKLIMG